MRSDWLGSRVLLVFRVPSSIKETLSDCWRPASVGWLARRRARRGGVMALGGLGVGVGDQPLARSVVALGPVDDADQGLRRVDRMGDQPVDDGENRSGSRLAWSARSPSVAADRDVQPEDTGGSGSVFRRRVVTSGEPSGGCPGSRPGHREDESPHATSVNRLPPRGPFYTRHGRPVRTR